MPAGSGELPLGTEARTAGGNTITVYGYEQPATGLSRFTPSPSSGGTYAAIDVGGCAGAQGSQPGLNPFFFELAMPDNTRLRASVSSKEPALHSGALAPGDCIRGWITYEVPPGQQPRFVVFTSSSVIKWKLQ